MVRSRNLIGERNEGPTSGRDDRLVTPPGQIHSDEYNRTADDLLDPQYLAKEDDTRRDRKSTRLNSSHANISYAVFCLKKKKKQQQTYNILEHIPLDSDE